jgi:hypothetical protein
MLKTPETKLGVREQTCNSETVLTTTDEVAQRYEDLKGELGGLAGDFRVEPQKFLTGLERHVIRSAIGGDAYAREVLGMRQRSMRQRWKRIVKEATRYPKTLGYITVEQGLDDVAQRFRCEPSTLFRNLRRWEAQEPPLVVCGYERDYGRKQRIAVIQIPLVSDWLLFMARANAKALGGLPNAMNVAQTRRLVRAYLKACLPPPLSVSSISATEAEKLITEARALAS